jgi:5'-nucleotidase
VAFNKMTAIRKTTILGLALAGAAAAGASGCQSQKKTDAATAGAYATPGVTDVTAVPSATPTYLPPGGGYAATPSSYLQPAPAYAAAPPQPTAPEPAPAPAPAAPTAGGEKYTVRKGDTLWKIATAHYGNGNQWQKIASANPGLSPATLKVGQTIAIP